MDILIESQLYESAFFLVVVVGGVLIYPNSVWSES